jgi:membrane-associated phospholipid phosphatase
VRGSEVRFEPNPIAAMPSIHFAATALLVFPARRGGRLLAAGAVVYAGLMGLALVYLGEHYVLDLVVGGALAALGWSIAGRWSAPGAYP